jgi:hypothetical protein
MGTRERKFKSIAATAASPPASDQLGPRQITRRILRAAKKKGLQSLQALRLSGGSSEIRTRDQ